MRKPSRPQRVLKRLVFVNETYSDEALVKIGVNPVYGGGDWFSRKPRHNSLAGDQGVAWRLPSVWIARHESTDHLAGFFHRLGWAGLGADFRYMGRSHRELDHPWFVSFRVGSGASAFA